MQTKLEGPIYLLRSQNTCYRCRKVAPVVALACNVLHEWDEGDDEYEPSFIRREYFDIGPVIISNVEQIDHVLLQKLHAFHPHYEKRPSRTAGQSYYMNICPHCGAHFGDFFMFSEPGGAFFPAEPEDAADIEYRELPLKGTYALSCGLNFGVGPWIMSHGRPIED